MARLGTALACLGLLVLAWGALWQLGLAPGSRVSLPAPVALERQRPPPGEPTAIPTVVTVSVVVEPAAATLPAARLEPADAVDRAQAQPRGANAVRLAIPAIKLDTPVEQGGIVEDASGQPVWQTLPFVAVHYG